MKHGTLHDSAHMDSTCFTRIALSCTHGLYMQVVFINILKKIATWNNWYNRSELETIGTDKCKLVLLLHHTNENKLLEKNEKSGVNGDGDGWWGIRWGVLMIETTSIM